MCDALQNLEMLEYENPFSTSDPLVNIETDFIPMVTFFTFDTVPEWDE